MLTSVRNLSLLKIVVSKCLMRPSKHVYSAYSGMQRFISDLDLNILTVADAHQISIAQASAQEYKRNVAVISEIFLFIEEIL